MADTYTPASKKRLGSYPYASVLLSITTALFVLGVFALLILDARTLSRMVRENLEVQVFLNNALSESERLQVEKVLAEKEYVKKSQGKAALRFIAKEQAAKELTQQLGEDFESLLGENPLKNSYILPIDAAYYQLDKLQVLEKDLRQVNGVVDVSYPQNLINDINKNIATISFILFSFVLFMSIIVIILIHNTIKLALFSQRFIIRTMQLVGATATFIRRPFLRTAAVQGALSGLLASALLFAFIQYIESQVEEFKSLHQYETLALIALILVLIGIFLSLLSSLRAVNKYLQMSLDELY
jgi:cell division transport system permease protein